MKRHTHGFCEACNMEWPLSMGLLCPRCWQPPTKRFTPKPDAIPEQPGELPNSEYLGKEPWL